MGKFNGFSRLVENEVVYSTEDGEEKKLEVNTGQLTPQQRAANKQNLKNLEKGILPESHLDVNRKVDLARYTAFELSCLVQDLFFEIKMRDIAVPSALQKADKYISDKEHDIEFGNGISNTEKLSNYEELQNLLGDRRKAKQENILIKRLNKLLKLEDINNFNRISQAVDTALDENSKVNRRKTEFGKGQFKRFREKYYLGK